MVTRSDRRSGGLVRKLIGVGVLLLAELAVASGARADIIQITNTTNPAFPIASFAGLLDMSYSEKNTSPGYDDGIDAELDTFISPYDFNFVTFATLDAHDVSVNKTPEPHIGDTYTFNLGFENDRGTIIRNKENYVTLNDFEIDNSNGVTDWEYELRVNTDSLGSTDEYTINGLVSDVWVSANKRFGQWEQDILQGTIWRNGNGRHYGELTFTAIGEPIVHLGDLTGNHYVDFQDLTLLLANWNQDVGMGLGNIVDRDNTRVDFQDLTALLADWTGPAPGVSPEAALGHAAVPEPSTLLLAAFATLGLIACRRRRRRAHGLLGERPATG